MQRNRGRRGPPRGAGRHASGAPWTARSEPLDGLYSDVGDGVGDVDEVGRLLAVDIEPEERRAAWYAVVRLRFDGEVGGDAVHPHRPTRGQAEAVKVGRVHEQDGCGGQRGGGWGLL